jgi:predicted CXXCH cytochrome family protein
MWGTRMIAVATVLLLSLLATAERAGAGLGSLSEESQYCAECHAKPGIIKFLENNDSLNAQVDTEALRNSVHGGLACTACHIEFAGGKHPTRVFRSLDQYRLKSSLICRRCHAEEQIKRRAVHQGIFQEQRNGKPSVCTNCHGSHKVARVSGKGSFTNEQQYCMHCHERGVPLRFRDGELTSLKVDPEHLKRSVHSRLSCSDCHYGFSSDEHPRRNFKTRRDLTLALSESCRRCHFDKYTKTLESIHYDMLSQGRLDAPVCTDCHGGHEVSRVGRERIASAKRCQRCHSHQYEVYANSVHGNALFNEHNQDVPVCVDCHTAHNIADPFSLDFRDQIPDMCSNCHAKQEVVGKYGLSTDVVKTYLADFHGITLELYRIEKGGAARPRKAIAVCTDCHGTHNITATSGGDPAVVKANLLKRCQQCHTDATENFPDAWLSHYEPSMKRSPFVFLAGIAYQTFIPIMIVGFILQVLLHIWRYAVNR